MFEKHIGSKLKSEGIREFKGIKDTAKEMMESFYARIGRIIKSEIDIEDSKEIKDMPTSEIEPKLEDELEIDETFEDEDIDESRSETTSERKREVSDDIEEGGETFPGSIEDVHLTGYLGGSSGVRAGFFNGELLVVKEARLKRAGWESGESRNTRQIIDEYIADRIYETMGFNVPLSKVYDNGLYKVAKFISGKDLNTFSRFSPDEEKVKKELQKGFVLDCLLANWDVIGSVGGDNIRLGDNGKVYRLNNGGALRFRARGEEKGEAFGFNVTELESMKRNEFFSDISDKEISRQIGEILEKQYKIFEVIRVASDSFLDLPEREFADLEYIIRERLNHLHYFKDGLDGKIKGEKKEKGIYESAVTNDYFEGWEDLEIEGNLELKVRIKKNIIKAENRNNIDYEQAAENLGISVEEFKRRLQAKIEDMVKNSQFFRATHVDVLDRIMNVDGRWKSQFETATSNGTLNPAYRAEQEMKMFGFNRSEVSKDFPDDFVDSAHEYDKRVFSEKVIEIGKEKRPIYGYFSDDEHGAINTINGRIPPPTNVQQYGRINFKIKKEAALKKATITFDDSLGMGQERPPTPAVKPHFTSLFSHYLDFATVSKRFLGNLKGTSLVNWGGGYTEVQYHGQLTMDDVESIHISINNGLTLEEIEEVREIFSEYKRNHPESTIQLIEF